MSQEDRADVEYRSPGPDVGPDKDASTRDEIDYSTLKRVHGDLKKEVKKLDSIDSLKVSGDDGLTVDQQLAANKKAKKIVQDSIDIIEKALQDVDAAQEAKT